MPRASTTTTKTTPPRKPTKAAPAPAPVAEFVTGTSEIVADGPALAPAHPSPEQQILEVTHRSVMMTPELAQQILGRNTRNRHIRPARVDRYAGIMVSGGWRLNGEAVVLSKQGNLMNGQHRLHAVVRAGVAVPMTLTENVEEDTFATMDTGMNRTAGDVLAMRGVANFNQVAAITRMLLKIGRAHV